MSEQRGIITRVATGLRYIVSGTAPADWFGPAQPLPPMAPPEVAGRSFDFPVGVNLRTAPRTDESIGFRELRALADAYDLLRLVEQGRQNDYLDQDQVQSPANVVRIPYYRHKDVQSYYQTPNPNLGGLTPRQYLRGKSYEEQFEFGLQALRDLGIMK